MKKGQLRILNAKLLNRKQYKSNRLACHYMKRLKILLSAHELSPFQGSECSVGWNIVTRLGKYHDIIAIYAKTNQLGTSDYESHIKSYISMYGPISGVRFIAIPQHNIARILSKISTKISKDLSIGFPGIYYFCYALWQKKVYRFSKELIRKERIDIAHHLTSVTYREPGYLWKLNIPFVWGPSGGFMPNLTALSFLIKATKKNITMEMLRYFSSMLYSKLSIKIYKAINKASCIYLFNKRDRLFFSGDKIRKIKMLLDTGSTPGSKIRKNALMSDKLRIIWCGRLVPSKAPDLFLEVLNSLAQWKEKIIIKIIGDGYLRPKLAQYATEHNLTNIEWIPHVDHEKVFQYMRDSDVLVHTSYREATSAVIPEALSQGLPVICHDAFGMAIAVNQTCGIKIPLKDYNTSLNGFRDAIVTLLENREILYSLKEGAYKRAEELSWDNMAQTIAKGYIEITNKDLDFK